MEDDKFSFQRICYGGPLWLSDHFQFALIGKELKG